MVLDLFCSAIIAINLVCILIVTCFCHFWINVVHISVDLLDGIEYIFRSSPRSNVLRVNVLHLIARFEESKDELTTISITHCNLSRVSFIWLPLVDQ